jgi:4-amino-4-deoxy-L-arabinose transferase-like glycosyltransferase
MPTDPMPAPSWWTERLTRGERLTCALLVLLAFAIRLAGTAVLEGLSAPPNGEAFYDGVEYEAIARHLVERGEYAVNPGQPTSFRAPGLPLLLAVVYAIAGPGNHFAAHVALSLVAALVVVPTFLLARLLGGPRAALVAGVIAAGYPNLAYYAIHFSSEPLHTVALTASVLLLVRALEADTPRRLLASGAWLGVATLARSVALYFLPFFSLALLPAIGLGRAARASLLMASGALLLVLPWAARNFRVHDRWLLVASNGGGAFWGSNNDLIARDPTLRGDWISTRLLRTDAWNAEAPRNEVDRDHAEFAEGKRWVRDNIASLPALVLAKQRRLWSPFAASPNRPFVLGTAAGYLIVLPLAIWGGGVLWRRSRADRHALLLLLAPMAGTAAASAAFYGSVRFRSPVEPFVIVLASIAAVHLTDRSK